MNKYTGILGGILLVLFAFAQEASCQQELVHILVANPYITDNALIPVSDVMAGCIVRELRMESGSDIINREMVEKHLKEEKGVEWIATREMAVEVGKELGADIVIYSTILKSYEIFSYRIALIEVKREIIQLVITGEFLISDSPSQIGRIMKKEMTELIKYVPLPSELADPGESIRDYTIDPDNLPKDHVIEDFPKITRYGVVERIFNYYRVFPGELEYQKLAAGSTAMRFRLQEEMDEELTRRFNLYQTYGDFALRHNLQAYFIEDCSTMAVNVLLANDIPVFYDDDILIEYYGLTANGYCWFKPLSSEAFDTSVMSHRDRMVVMIMLPKPGRKGGISREYLEAAVGRYEDEWGKTPTLKEITEGLLDLESSL